MAEFFYICIFFCIFSVKNYLFQSITEVTSKNSLFEPPKKVGYKNSHSQTKEEVSFKHSQLLLESKREASLKVLYNNFQVKDIHMLFFVDIFHCLFYFETWKEGGLVSSGYLCYTVVLTTRLYFWGLARVATYQERNLHMNYKILEIWTLKFVAINDAGDI